MKAKKLNLTIQSGSVRNGTHASIVDSASVQNVISLFDGVTVECKVYSKTNICFNITESMIDKAWKSADKERLYWFSESTINDMKSVYTVNGKYGILACSLPSVFCVQTPNEIEEMLK